MAINTKIVHDVDFPKFTGNLISNVFTTIQQNHLDQINSYKELVTAMNDINFVDNNYLKVSDEAIMDFISQDFELKNNDSDNPIDYISIKNWFDATEDEVTYNLNAESYTKINKLFSGIKVDGTDVIINDETIKEYVLIAVRKFLVKENQSSIKEMVKIGMLRIVTEKITLKTKLTFDASESTYDFSNDTKSEYGSKGFNIGGGLSYKNEKKGIAAFISGGYSNVKTTVNSSYSSSSNSSSNIVNLLGYVKIEARSDYQSLS